MELPLLHVAFSYGTYRRLIDSDALFMQSNEIASRLTALEKQAYDSGSAIQFSLHQTITKKFCSINLGYLFYKKRPKVQPSTNEEVLEELSYSHELPKNLVEHRGVEQT